MSDDEFTSAQATRAVKKALDDAEVGHGDYEVSSHKSDEGITTTVTVSGWAHPELRQLIATALKSVEGASKPKQDGGVFTLHFS